MVNKKGFIRTLEAVIAIILILTFIFWITPKVIEVEEKVPEDIANAKEFILNQILFNKEYGQCIANARVINGVNSDNICEKALNLDDLNCKKIMGLFDYVPYGYDFACEICSSSLSCIPLQSLYPKSEGKSLYTNTIFIYRADTNYNIMRIYIWKK